MKINAVIRLDYNQFYADAPNFLTSCWGCQSGYVYVKMHPGTDIRQVEAREPNGRKGTSPTR